MTENDPLENIARGSILTFLGIGVSQILSYAAIITITNLFGASTFGAFKLGMVVLNLSVLLTTLGIGEGLVHFIGKSKSIYDTLELYWTAILITLLPTITVSIFMFVEAEYIANLAFNSGRPGVFLKYFAVGLPFVVISQISIQVTRGLNYASPTNIINRFIDPLLKISAYVIAAVFSLGIIGISIGVTIVHIVISIISVAILLWIIISKVTKLGDLVVKPRRDIVYPLLTYSLPVMLSNGSWFLMNTTDTFLVGYFLADKFVGIYAAAFSLAGIYKLIDTSFSTLFLPNISRLYDGGELEEVKTIYNKVTKLMIILAIPICLVLIGLSSRMMTIFGPGFDTGKSALVVFAIGMFAYPGTGPVAEIMKAFGETKASMYIGLIALISNTILNIILIPRFNLLGAALATSFSLWTFNLALVIYLKIKYGFYFSESRFVFATLLFLIPALAILSDQGGILLTSGSLISYLLYLVILYKLNLLGSDAYIYTVKVVSDTISKFLAR